MDNIKSDKINNANISSISKTSLWTIKNIGKNYIQIDGIIEDTVDNNIIYYIAPCPSDRHNSFSGSGLPFYNKSQAFENTPNNGKLNLKENNSFLIKVIKPNSYYDNVGNNFIEPELTIYYYNNKNKKELKINLKNRIPFRHLEYNDINSHDSTANNIMFYENINLPVRTQEQILYDSQYPNNYLIPANYWGLKPSST
jgi:hypothetical protein